MTPYVPIFCIFYCRHPQVSLNRFLENEATESIANSPPSDGMLFHRKVTYPQQYDAGTNFIPLGAEKQCGLKFLV